MNVLREAKLSPIIRKGQRKDTKRLQLKDFYYDLPPERIAQTPSSDRSASRLLVYDRSTQGITDAVFSALPQYLQAGDVLVRNTTRVIPARLMGIREETGGSMEFLLLRRVNGDDWEALLRPGRRAKNGNSYTVGQELRIAILKDLGEGIHLIRLEYEGVLEEILDRIGEMPLPPYITQKLDDQERYQTIYSNQHGSAAAPTAGLHFTEALFDEIRARGVTVVDILLHVGLGTFRPVSAERIEDHIMHEEYYEVGPEAAAIINTAKAEGRRIIAIGTTVCRTLESVADEHGHVRSGAGWTNIFITPGYRFRVINALVTNFHLPESTLLMLVSALASKEDMLRVYAYAIRQEYRFFSFGDAMFIQ